VHCLGLLGNWDRGLEYHAIPKIQRVIPFISTTETRASEVAVTLHIGLYLGCTRFEWQALRAVLSFRGIPQSLQANIRIS
jgi:hypothetical protein